MKLTAARAYYSLVDRTGDHTHEATWRGRCVYCGHRVGDNVIETRRQPWRIPSEIVHRFLAMGHGDLKRTPAYGWLHVEHYDTDAAEVERTVNLWLAAIERQRRAILAYDEVAEMRAVADSAAQLAEDE